MSQESLTKTLEERGESYNRHGDFHTLANLTQTLDKIITQHYTAVRSVDGQQAPQMPHFMAESLHMICQKIARICNGNESHVDHWQDIAGYSQLVVNILEAYNEKVKEAQALAEAEAKANAEVEKPSVQAELPLTKVEQPN